MKAHFPPFDEERIDTIGSNGNDGEHYRDESLETEFERLMAKELELKPKKPEVYPACQNGIPTNPDERKQAPIYEGFLKYFPDAVLAVAECSYFGNLQHNPDKPLFWDRSKSTDEKDALVRHLMEAGTIDTDGLRHSTKVAWRSMSSLQKEIEKAKEDAKKS